MQRLKDLSKKPNDANISRHNLNIISIINIFMRINLVFSIMLITFLVSSMIGTSISINQNIAESVEKNKIYYTLYDNKYSLSPTLLPCYFEGRVLDADTRDPIKDVEVTFVKEDGDPLDTYTGYTMTGEEIVAITINEDGDRVDTYTGTTNTEGAYRVRVPKGRYTYLATHPEYVIYSSSPTSLEVPVEEVIRLSPELGKHRREVDHKVVDISMVRRPESAVLETDDVCICNIPEGHQHVRYGRGFIESLVRPGYYTSSDIFVVCSAGQLICSIPTWWMMDPNNTVYIYGNDLDNTIMPSGFSGVEIAPICRYTADLRLLIHGWDQRWNAELRLYGRSGNDWLIGGPGDDYLFGGGGNDMINGADGNNYIYGQTGYDVMHGGNEGICSGGSPTIDTYCFTEGSWPHRGTAGDCCCHSCVNHLSCTFSDVTPGISDPIPTPW